MSTKSIIHSITAGILSFILVLNFSLATVAMIAPPNLSDYLPTIMFFGFISLIIGNLITCIKSSFPFAVVLIDPMPNAIVAAMVATVATNLITSNQTESLLPTILTIIAISTFGAGLCSYLLGYFNLGSVIRYIPYPVIGGFVSTSGLLIIKGGYSLILTTPLSLNLTIHEITLLLISTAYGVYLFYLRHKNKNIFYIPISFILFIIIAHLYLFAMSIPFSSAIANGWFFVIPHLNLSFSNFNADFFNAIAWHQILIQTPSIIASIILLILLLLLSVIGMEDQSYHPADINRELKMTGVSNITAGLFYGPNHTLAMSVSLFNLKSGATSRISGLTVACCCLLSIFYGDIFLSHIPKFILCAFLLFVGFNIIYEWLYLAWFRLPLEDYLQIIAIIICSALIGLVFALLLGFIFSCLRLVYQASCLNPIQLITNGSEYNSSVIRPGSDQRILITHGKATHIIKLQGILFFGVADNLYHSLANKFAHDKDIKFLVIDFTNCPLLDTGVRLSFMKLERLLRERQAIMIFVNFTKEVHTLFNMENILNNDNVKLFASLDEALQYCEKEILQQHSNVSKATTTTDIASFFRHKATEEELLQYFNQIKISKGSTLIEQGQQSNEMYLLKKGTLSVIRTTNNEKKIISTILPGSTVGEMAFFSCDTRVASVIALSDCELYQLTRINFHHMEKQAPHLTAQLNKKIISLLIMRLRYANRK